MKTIMSKTPHDSFSLSKRYFNWKNKPFSDEQDHAMEEQILKSSHLKRPSLHHSLSKKLWAALSIGPARTMSSSGRGPKPIGTLFGHRRGHVHFALQQDSKAGPTFLIQLATPTSVLVKEMASGLVRIALECEKRAEKRGFGLLNEPVWRTYCNGRKCGYAVRRDCGPEESRVLEAIGPVSMGAGVLPGAGGAEAEGEMMYMRAKFERVVGSRDSEAFYMMNPDGNGGPELSIYLLRV